MQNKTDYGQTFRSKSSGTVCWESPSNIALVKYWGKYPRQLPMNPSVSFALRESVVRICIDYRVEPANSFRIVSFSLNGEANTTFLTRIDGYLRSLEAYFPFLQKAHLKIDSYSTFPHSAGIASSAAAYGALALCICSIEAKLKGVISDEPKLNSVISDEPKLNSVISDEPKLNSVISDEPKGATINDDDFYRRASFFARLGSGSAARSVYNGLTLWGRTDRIRGSSNEHAVRLDDTRVHPKFMTLRDAILIVDDGAKAISSSAGHALMHNHPFRETRKQQADNNLGRMLLALAGGNTKLFGEVVENEALTLHSLMMSSNPGYVLMKPNTLIIIEKIRKFRESHNLDVCFTLDAGPNIHMLYFKEDKKTVQSFINDELAPLCESNRWIDDAIGNGPKMITNETH